MAHPTPLLSLCRATCRSVRLPLYQPTIDHILSRRFLGHLDNVGRSQKIKKDTLPSELASYKISTKAGSKIDLQLGLFRGCPSASSGQLKEVSSHLDDSFRPNFTLSHGARRTIPFFPTPNSSGNPIHEKPGVWEHNVVQKQPSSYSLSTITSQLFHPRSPDPNQTDANNSYEIVASGWGASCPHRSTQQPRTPAVWRVFFPINSVWGGILTTGRKPSARAPHRLSPVLLGMST